MKRYFIELNGKYIKSYKSKEQALQVAKSYTNGNNSVTVWDNNRNIIVEF